MYKKLGISVDEQKMMNNVAMDMWLIQFQSYNIQENIREKGIIFMSISGSH
jgi:Fe-S cluster assembly protein SufB